MKLNSLKRDRHRIRKRWSKFHPTSNNKRDNQINLLFKRLRSVEIRKLSFVSPAKLQSNCTKTINIALGVILLRSKQLTRDVTNDVAWPNVPCMLDIIAGIEIIVFIIFSKDNNPLRVILPVCN